MTSVLKAQKANASKFESKGKRKADAMDVDGGGDIAEVSAPKKKRNKQRVLLLSSRGITHRMRHFMNDLEALLPHVKKGVYIKMPSRSLLNKNSDNQIRSSTQNPNFISFQSSQTLITVTTRYISKRDDMKIYTCGPRRRRMGQASNYMFRTCTRWMS